MKKVTFVLILLAALAVTSPAFAAGGCYACEEGEGDGYSWKYCANLVEEVGKTNCWLDGWPENVQCHLSGAFCYYMEVWP